jgi:hypothetical protein
MRRRRAQLLAATVAGATLVGVGVSGSVGGAGETRFPAERARYFNLPDGDAQIGVSTSDEDDIVVRWRDADGSTWSDPDVVYHDDEGRMLTGMRIRLGGPTLALVATFTPEDSYYDDESTVEELTVDDVTTFVVCRRGTCSSSRAYPGAVDEPPQVTPDGQHALLGEVDGVYVGWHDGDVVEQHPTGLPDGDYGAGQPVLAPDGSLRAGRGSPTPAGCDFTLWTTMAGQVGYERAARYQDRRDLRERCTTRVETFSPDYVVVSRSKYDAWFLARTEDGWRRVADDPSGQVRYPRTGGPKLAGAFERSGFWHWREVLASSPDGHTLMVQVHEPGAERWEPPQVVARAPRGARCLSIDPMPTYTSGEEDPFYVNLRCRSRARPGAEWVYSFPTAVSDDGRTWSSFLATDSGVRVGPDLFFSGRPAHRWTPETGLERIGLRVPRGAELTLLPDGSYARSELVRSHEGCEVEVRLAGSGNDAWSTPLPNTSNPVPLDMCAFDSVQGGDGKNVYHYLRTAGSGNDHRMVRLVWRDGDPIVEDGPS